MIYDAAILGAGIVGALVSRALSFLEISACLIDRFPEPGCGTSKANSAIVHAGYDPEPGSLKARLNLRGTELMESLCRELYIPYKKTGSLVISNNPENDESLEILLKRGEENHVPDLEIINRKALLELEPNLAGTVRGALFAKSAGIVNPFLLACAAAENAAENGVELMLGRTVEDYTKSGDIFEINLNGQIVKSRYLINCAGVYSHHFCGDPDFHITPVKGEYLLLDRRLEGYINRVLFRPPGKNGKGILASPTVHGNIILGPTAETAENSEDLDTTASGRQKIIGQVREILPEIDLSAVITSFTGIRAVPSGGDFIVEASPRVPGLINCAGIESPGLTAAPAIAERVLKIIRQNGFLSHAKQYFIPLTPPPVLSEMSLEERDLIIKKDPSFGRIVCRCEGISEGEITDAVRRKAGARTLDGVKRRVRGGMGRCQGSFCAPRVIEIISRELNVPPAEITKKGGGSKLIAEDQRGLPNEA